MGEIRFYNSLTKKLEDWQPANPKQVKIYHCGPTVYKRQHIGNMRRFLFADFLRRSLQFLGYGVNEVTNITDVGHLTQDDIDAGEDKLAKEAKAQKTTPEAIATKEIDQFFEDLKALNIQRSEVYPRATEHIQEMQDLITKLIESEHAYTTDTGVYYDVKSWPDYGKLSGNTLDKLAAGSRIEVRDEKRHPSDFALWIFDDQALQKWESPWGTGYPGWHIECSAMSEKHLGRPIDIHTGGLDNKFPHHENEIAQSESVSNEPFVRLWMHNALLNFDGEKLAKRAGEQITVDTLREKGYSPLVFRWLVFSSHYRTPLEFSWEALDSARDFLESIEGVVRRMHLLLGDDKGGGNFDANRIDDFSAALADDLNTPRAAAEIASIIKAFNNQFHKAFDKGETVEGIEKKLKNLWAGLMEMDKVVGIIGAILLKVERESVPAEVLELVNRREDARDNKAFTESDRLRDEIATLGYIVEDTGAEPRIIKKGS